MPPCASHQATMSFTALPISWSRPGTPAKPLSSPYAMLMVVLVTPESVAPVAFPFPQGEGRVPNEVVETEPELAPDTGLATRTPVAVSAETNSASPMGRMHEILFILTPRSDQRNRCRLCS